MNAAPAAAAPAAAAPAATAAPAAAAPNAANAAPAAPANLGDGIYAIPDAPPPPPPTAVAAGGAAAVNNTGPTRPAEGKDLLVIMTIDGASQNAVYKAQQNLRQKVATTAGVGQDKVLFYNQTARTDPRTGQSTYSLTMQVACGDVAECSSAGGRLFNSTAQANLTRELAQDGVSVLPSTLQVYGGNLARKGTDTLAPLPRTAATAAPKPAATASPLLPGLAVGGLAADGTGLDGTATMPATMMPGATARAGGLGAGTAAGADADPFAALNADAVPAGMAPIGAAGAGFGDLNATAAAGAPVIADAAPAKAKSSAGAAAAGAATLLATGAALLLL